MGDWGAWTGFRRLRYSSPTSVASSSSRWWSPPFESFRNVEKGVAVITNGSVLDVPRISLGASVPQSAPTTRDRGLARDVGRNSSLQRGSRWYLGALISFGYFLEEDSSSVAPSRPGRRKDK